ncbi:MAG: hypothetical protein RI973_881, partial [Bacteroidota bacterium]
MPVCARQAAIRNKLQAFRFDHCALPLGLCKKS